MRPSGRIVLCSWETPYDFTPRIHHYPGVDRGVVREAWERGPRLAEGDTAPPRRRRFRWKAPKAPKGARPRSPQPGLRPSATIAARKGAQPPPATSRTPKARDAARQRPQPQPQEVRPPSAALGNTYDVSPRRPQPHPPPLTPPAETSQAAMATAFVMEPRRPPVRPVSAQVAAEGRATQPVPPPVRRRRRFQQRAALPQRGESGQVRRYTTADIAELLQRTTRQQQQQPHFTAGAEGEDGDVDAGPVQQRYAPRTTLAYTLPPQYGQWQRWLRSHRTLQVQYRDSYRSRHAPPALHTAFLPRQHAQPLSSSSVEVLLEALDRDVPPLLSASAAVVHSSDPGNFNANVLDVYASSYEARRAALVAQEEKVYNRLVGGLIPVEDVLAPAAAVPESDDGVALQTVECVAVLDNGHVDDPIVVANAGEATDASQGPIPVEAGGVAVLVCPIERELAAFTDTSASAKRHTTVGGLRPQKPAAPPLPRGREWDRQRAIQFAVGTTAQEALIDLQIDPRYRRPGEYVRWRHDGGQRRAVK